MKAILLLLTFFIHPYNAQKHVKIDLIGVWKVSGVTVDSSSPMANNTTMIAQAKVIMSKMTFNFKANHHFVMDGGFQNQKMPEGIWQYDSEKGTVKVTEVGDSKSRLMEITVTQDKKGQILFSLLETPVILKVYK